MVYIIVVCIFDVKWIFEVLLLISVSIFNGIYVCDLNFNWDISIEFGIFFVLVVIFLVYVNKYFKYLVVINIVFEELL